jgi:hypothetical protein
VQVDANARDAVWSEMAGKDCAKKAAACTGVFGSSSRASRESIDKGKALSEAELLDWWCAVDPHQAPQCVWIKSE